MVIITQDDEPITRNLIEKKQIASFVASYTTSDGELHLTVLS